MRPIGGDITPCEVAGVSLINVNLLNIDTTTGIVIRHPLASKQTPRDGCVSCAAAAAQQ